MRRKPYLSLLLALAILGGMLALFPTVWMALGIVLIALVTVQVIVVRRHLYRLPGSVTEGAPPVAATATPSASARVTAARGAGTARAASGDTPAEGPPQGASPASPPTPPENAPQQDPAPAPVETSDAPAASAGQGANIDMAVFSRFRRHLEQAEAQARGESPPATPLEETEVEDRVELSRRVRPPAAAKPPGPPRPPPEPTARRRQTPAEEEEDLFADLRTPPPPQPSAQPSPATPADKPPATGSEAGDRPKPAPKPQPVGAQRPQPETPQAESSAETGASAGEAAPSATPTSQGAEATVPPAQSASAPVAKPATPKPESGGDEGLADEAEALLHMAEEAAGRADWDRLRASLDNYTAHLATAPHLIHWRARRLQTRLAVHDGDANRALQGFEELLSAGYKPTVEGTPALLDTLLEGAETSMAASLRVSMLVRILAGFRQARDQRAMDRCYSWIEEAQEQVGDERRLLQYLKNHLEIRKVLGDLPGQLELIDQLGNRCYRLGLTEDAKVYYEMGLRLRAEAERNGELAPRRATADAEDESGDPSTDPAAREASEG